MEAIIWKINKVTLFWGLSDSELPFPGEDFYKSSERYFGHRQRRLLVDPALAGTPGAHAGLWESQKQNRSAIWGLPLCGNPGGTTCTRASFCKTLSTASEADVLSNLAHCARASSILRARELLLLLLLRWHYCPAKLVGDDKVSIWALLSDESNPDPNVFSSLLLLLRLCTSKSWSPEWKRLRVASNAAMDPEEEALLLAKTLGFRPQQSNTDTPTAQQLLLPVLSSAMTPSASAPGHAGFVQFVLDYLRSELATAGLRKWGEVDQSEKALMCRRESKVLSEPVLGFYTWLTHLLLQLPENTYGLLLGAVEEPCRCEGGCDLVLSLIKSWSQVLCSPSLGVKELVCSVLSSLLTHVCTRLPVDCSSRLRIPGVLNRPRLLRLASRRLEREEESHPAYSRYMQRLLELCVCLEQVVFETVGSSDGSTTSAIEEKEEAVTPVTVVGGLFSRPALRLPSGGTSFVRTHVDSIQPPWTVEMWVRRGPASAPHNQTSASATAGAPVKLSRQSSMRGLSRQPSSRSGRTEGATAGHDVLCSGGGVHLCCDVDPSNGSSLTPSMLPLRFTPNAEEGTIKATKKTPCVGFSCDDGTSG